MMNPSSVYMKSNRWLEKIFIIYLQIVLFWVILAVIFDAVMIGLHFIGRDDLTSEVFRTIDRWVYN